MTLVRGDVAAASDVPPAVPADRPANLGSRFGIRSLAGYLLVMPALGILTLFFYVPAVFLFVMSFYHWNLFGGSVFAGFANFDILFHQPLYFESLLETAYFVGVMVPVDALMGLALAMLLREGYRRSRAGGFGRALVFLPHVTPVVATSVIWAWVFNPRYGLANYLLGLLGAPQPGWLDSATWALPAVMVYSIWHSVGYYAVFFLAGLAMVPDTVVEAARVDGASSWQTFRRVVAPLLSPTTFMVLILATVNSMQTFSQVYTLTGGPHGGAGGPAFSTSTDALLIYNTAFIYQHLSLAAAMSLVLFVILLLITGIQKRLSRRWVFYGGTER